jgi:phage-related protein
MYTDENPKAIIWIGSSREELRSFPKAVQRDIGQALYAAQRGKEYSSVKALKGFGGRSVLEVVADHDGDTFRAVYTVRFRDVLYIRTRSRRNRRRESLRLAKKSP